MIIGTFTCYNENDIIVLQAETLLCLCDRLIIQGDNPTPEVEEIIKSYEKNELVDVIINKKENNFFQRDERGDRERLLVMARGLGAKAVFHTETDEVLRMSDIHKMTQYLKEYKYDHIIQIPKYDLWYNAHNYRIPYDSNIFAGEEIENHFPPVMGEYVFPVTKDATYGKSIIPNFHVPRVPHYKNEIETRLYDDLHVIHYGYYKKSVVENKKQFYQTDKRIAGDVWGKDMQVNCEEFKKYWGIGYIRRKNDTENS